MKKVLLICFALMCTMLSFSQSENTVLKLIYNGYTTTHSFSLINLVNCTVQVQISVNGGSTYERTLSAKQTLNINVSGGKYDIVTVKSRVKENVSCVNNEVFTWIYSKSNIVLPIKFGTMTAKRLDPKTIRFTFQSEEDNTIDHYNVRISFDGKSYSTYTVVIPNGIIGNKTYEVIIKQ